MECEQGAPGSVLGIKKASVDEALCMTGAAAGNGVAGEDLFVNEFLDFSHVFPDAEEQPQKPEELEEKEQDREKGYSVSHETRAPPDFRYLPESFEDVFAAPAEGLESLEWLSHFVEESFSFYPLTGKLPLNATDKRLEPPPPPPAAENPPDFVSAVQTKARTKRARTGVRVWPVLSSSFTESSTTSSSSSTASFSPMSPTQTIESHLGNPLFKRKKKKPADNAASIGNAAAGQSRRCSHCGVTKTPQWRAGPLGSKTLCNACGVRFKSGRLLPEYRPACSPTFLSEVHSNNHRKVLEMRRKKEAGIEPSGLGPPVPGY